MSRGACDHNPDFEPLESNEITLEGKKITTYKRVGGNRGRGRRGKGEHEGMQRGDRASVGSNPGTSGNGSGSAKGSGSRFNAD